MELTGSLPAYTSAVTPPSNTRHKIAAVYAARREKRIVATIITSKYSELK